MTCIVGLIDRDNVYIGGDSAGTTSRFDIDTRADKKVFRNGDFIFGFTSSFRMGQLLQYNFCPPKHDKDIPVERYMVSVFIEAVRACLKEGGYATINNNEEFGGTFLVGYEKRLFCVNDDFQVAEFTCGYTAIGCGYALALGSMYSTSTMPPEERIRQALSASEKFNATVRGPFHIIKLYE